MTEPPCPPAAPRLRPFADNPARWDAERSFALQEAWIADGTGSSSAADEPYLVHERTGWGWLAWTVPADGSMPEQPHQIGVLPPSATWTDRLAARWLTRRPAGRMALHATSRGSLRYSAVAVIGCLAAVDAIARGVHLGIAVPVALLAAPLLADHLPDRLDMRARRRVRIVQGTAATGYLKRLAVLQTGLLRAASGNDRYEVRRSAEVGQQLLWDAADLLQTQDNIAASAGLIAREQLMLQLTHQVAQILTPAAGDNIPRGNQATALVLAVAPFSPGVRMMTRPLPRHAPPSPPQKGSSLMPQTDSRHPVGNVYLLFAHEPYYPDPAWEINTTVVSADSLLHPRVPQPDGARIHTLLQARQPGEIVPLSTLTHELDGGARWKEVGDWEAVTENLLQLVRERDCDALSLGLPELSRALLCAAPHTEVRTVGSTYGPTDRTEVLAQVGRQLAWAEAGSPLWPGDNLLPPINSVGRPTGGGAE